MHSEREETVTKEDGRVGNFLFSLSDSIDAESFAPIYDLFVEYKLGSDISDEMPAPSVDVQKDYFTVVSFFGKDKLGVHPRKECKEENLYHLHVFDGGVDKQELAKWVNKAQYHRVGNTYIVYSFFIHNDIFYFHIIDYIEADFDEDGNPDGGHEAIAEDEVVFGWIEEAKQYRISVKD